MYLSILSDSGIGLLKLASSIVLLSDLYLNETFQCNNRYLKNSERCVRSVAAKNIQKLEKYISSDLAAIA
jgi:hypothetical protein